MVSRFRRPVSAALASAAALAMTATPAMARHYHRDRGIDGGDIVAGVLILGGIAAVAAAAGNANKDRRTTRYPDYRYPRDNDYRTNGDWRDRDYRYDDRRDRDYDSGRGDWRGGESMDAAVDACTDELSRGRRDVEGVDSVRRVTDGWRVEGRLRDGRNFSCTADNGRIRQVAVDGQGII